GRTALLLRARVADRVEDRALHRRRLGVRLAQGVRARRRPARDRLEVLSAPSPVARAPPPRRAEPPCDPHARHRAADERVAWRADEARPRDPRRTAAGPRLPARR